MRWDDLFADLEAQADALETAARGTEVGERTRIELGTLGLGERLSAAVGEPLHLRVAGDTQVAGTLVRVGVDWLLVDEGAGREALVATGAVLAVGGLGRAAAAPGSGGAVHARLTLRHALRGIARDRSAVRVHLVDGSVLDATVDRVGADFADVAVHPPGEARRRGEVRGVQLVALVAIAAVRRSA